MGGIATGTGARMTNLQNDSAHEPVNGTVADVGSRIPMFLREIIALGAVTQSVLTVVLGLLGACRSLGATCFTKVQQEPPLQQTKMGGGEQGFKCRCTQH